MKMIEKMKKFKNNFLGTSLFFMLLLATCQASENLLVGTYMINTMVVKQPNLSLEYAVDDHMSVVLSGYSGVFSSLKTSGLSGGVRFYNQDAHQRFDGQFLEFKYGYSGYDYSSSKYYADKTLWGYEFSTGHSWHFNNILVTEWKVGITSYTAGSFGFFPIADFGIRLGL